MLKNSDPALYQSFVTARECHQRGDLAGAEAIYSRLLALDPADDEVLYLFGHLQASKGELAVGLDCLQLAQQLKPSNPLISYSIGVMLQESGRLAEAADAYRKAAAIDPACRMAWENLCAACYDMADYSSGLAAAEQALALDRESPLAIRGAANCLTALGRRAEALALLEQGLKYHPALPEFRIHRSWELMANGRFAEAWPELEWRHARRGKTDTPPRSVPYPRWNGEALAGKTVLVYGEQGIGDEIMYAPYVLGLVRAGARCVLECEPRLERLFAQAFPECLILHREDREQIAWHAGLPEIDYCISALSLPLYFAHPLDRRSFLKADAGRTGYWRQRLQESGPGLKVGVSWRGGADAKVRAIRSIPESVFGQLIEQGATFVSLQYGATAAEAAAVSKDLLHFSGIDPLRDLDEFCALVSALDVVVSVDNSTVHIAGALGVRTLLLLPVYSEWRWGNQPSGVSSWYQSLELIRQPVASEAGWRELMAEARRWLAAGKPASAIPVDEPVSGQQSVADIFVVPAIGGRSALLVGDTNYWYHWGCSCTSLGLHEGLRTRFAAIRVLPLPRLLSACPTPSGLESLDSDVFFAQFKALCPDVLAAMEAADCLVINGEGSMHGASPLPLLLLYLAYTGKKRLGKQVAVVNHSCYPGDAVFPGSGTAVREYYAKVYKALDFAVVRESLSMANVSSFAGKVSLGFDCLPLFLSRHRQPPYSERQRKIVLGGSVSWTPEMVDCFASLAEWGAGEGFAVEILSGAKAFLASDEVGFVEQMVRALEAKKVAHTLSFPVSELAWLAAIGSASLVVSGRFYDSIAAAFQGVPFVVLDDDFPGISALPVMLGLDPALVLADRDAYGAVVGKGQRLLSGGTDGRVGQEHLDRMIEQAKLNFLTLCADEMQPVVQPHLMPSAKQKELIELYSRMAQEGYQTVGGQHIEVAFSDMEIRAFKDAVKPLFQKFSIKSLLDYGCGGSDYEAPGFVSEGASAKHFFELDEVFLYEPARAIDQRQVSDAVVCFDVLEHIFISDVPRVVRELFSLSVRLLVVNVACYPARALLPNGENAHITVRPPLWWKGLFDSIAVEFPSVAVQLWCSTGWRDVEGFNLVSAGQWNEGGGFVIAI